MVPPSSPSRSAGRKGALALAFWIVLAACSEEAPDFFGDAGTQPASGGSSGGTNGTAAVGESGKGGLPDGGDAGRTFAGDAGAAEPSSGGSGGTSPSESGGANAGGSAATTAGGVAGASSGGSGGASSGGVASSGTGGAGGTNSGGSGAMANACSPVPVARLCVMGLPLGSGDQISVGDRLQVGVTPQGCFSSSCTEAVIANCSVTGHGPTFEVSAEFCYATTDDPPCTKDCSAGKAARCMSETPLAEGEHTVTLGELSVTFTVPGIILPNVACASAEP